MVVGVVVVVNEDEDEGVRLVSLALWSLLLLCDGRASSEQVCAMRMRKELQRSEHALRATASRRVLTRK